MARAVDAIHEAKRPILMVGAGANRKTSSRMLREFVDKTGIPFFTTQMGKGVIDEAHPLWIGNAALSDGDFVHRAIEHADCIINVGHDVIEKPPFFMRRRPAHGHPRQLLQRRGRHGLLPADRGDRRHRQLDLALKEAITPQKHWDFGYFDKARTALATHLRSAPTTTASRSTRSGSCARSAS